MAKRKAAPKRHPSGPPWLSFRGLTKRYSLSEATFRRMMQAKLWPAGEMVAEGRRVFSQPACDAAFQKLLARRDQAVEKLRALPVRERERAARAKRLAARAAQPPDVVAAS